jgi:LacI family transcriptional regulator
MATFRANSANTMADAERYIGNTLLKESVHQQCKRLQCDNASPYIFDVSVYIVLGKRHGYCHVSVVIRIESGNIQKMATEHSAPTLSDVAREAGVSTATVSRCLNSPEQVVERTRIKVMEAVMSLGYSPNFGARAMAAKRTKTIGAIIPTMENAIFARSVQAFQEELGVQGYTLLVASTSYRMDLEEEQIRSLVARGADGLLLIGHDREDSILQFLETQNVPALVAWTFEKDARLPCIGFDNRRSMRALADKAIGLGHRKIGMISGLTHSNDRARGRVDGIREAMQAAGMDPQSLQLVETAYGIETGGQAFAKIMSSDTPPTVILCGNDVLAVGAVKQAARQGIAVPDDVSITGFDDNELASVVSPELTTVHVPHRAMGSKAARMLLDMVRNNFDGQSLELEANIQVRESLSPPRTRV